MPARPLLLGHRGARATRSIPENTFESFDRALADGCDGFEFDVRLSADRQAVVFHDDEVGRQAIAETPAASLANLPTLAGVLRRYQQTAFLDIELKVPGLERIALKLVEHFPPRLGFVLSSFLRDPLRQLRQMDACVPLGLICEHRKQLAGWRDESVQYLIAHQRLMSEKLVREVAEEEKALLVWTVNRPEQMRRFANWGVSGIISDQTLLLAKTFK